MPLQDLTPQLRTRLSRMERAVGIFVGLAALVLLSGFFYYLYNTAVRKGWFLRKVPYYVYVKNASGLKAGDPVKLMGFDVGEITEVTPMPPDEWFVVNQYNVFVGFLVKSPNYGYIWTDSRVKVSASDFLGKRVLEVTKGQTGAVTVVEKNDVITGLLDKDMSDTYVPPEKTKGGVWVREVEESPTATEKLDQIVKSIESALPALTNQLATLLNNGAHAVSNFNMLTVSTQPVATNLAEITAELREFNGSLGRWLFSTSFNYQLDLAATNANSTLTGVDTNMLVLAEKLSLSFDHLASITSNLNEQVRSNTNVLSAISQAVSHSDEFVQGLKRHWLLRSAFKTKSTNSPPARPVLRPGRPQP
jgi:ABC-type transporter Mla subunit MlaD